MTLLSEAIKQARPALAPDPRPLRLRRGAGQPGTVRASHSGRPAGSPEAPGPAARMLGQRRRLGGRGGRGEREIAHMEAHGVQKCSRRRLLSSRRAARSGRLRFSAKRRGPCVSPPHQRAARRWTSGRREPGGCGAQVPGSGFAARPRGSAPRLGPHGHHPRPQAAVAPRGPRSSAQDPISGAGAFVPLTDPLHHARQRESPRPAPASSRLRSHAQVSITLKVGAALGGGPRGRARRPLRPSRRGHPTPPPNSPARTAPRAPGHVPSPKPTQGAFGACRSHWPRSELARREAGWKEESDLKSHSSSLPPPKTSRGVQRQGRAPAPPPLARTGSAARPARHGAKRRVS